jgi:hypothetical protein
MRPVLNGIRTATVELHLQQCNLLQDEVQLCENFSAKTGRRNSTPDNGKEV